jgi:hypothetical protein
VFQDLDNTLTVILNDPAMPASLVSLRNAAKSFVTPDKSFAPAQPTVNLFLYEVKENRQLRDPEPIVERVGTSFVQRPPPLRVDCCYLVTTWSNQAGAIGVAEAHGLLAQALLWLSRFPTVPSTYLQGSLANQLYSPPTLVAQIDPHKNIGEFWFALGVPPRPAFHLTVTIAMELGLQVEGPIVTTTVTDYQLSDQPEKGVGKAATSEVWVHIGGYVLLAGLPRPASFGSATVTAINAAGTTVTVDNVTPFAVGDFVTKDNVGRAKITQIQGNKLTLNVALTGLAVGDVLSLFHIQEASVRLEDGTGTQLQTTVADEEGKFIFTKIRSGNYTLRVRAVGFAEATRNIVVPSTTGEYDVQLS